MNVQNTVRAGEDYTTAALIDAATKALAARDRGVPDDFLVKLFGLGVPEDLERYSADELAAFAEQSWIFIAERKAGKPKLRFEPATARPGVSVLEILNDDMPFLVDFDHRRTQSAQPRYPPVCPSGVRH